LLEIIFTLLTLKVPCEAEEPPTPLDGELLAPAPAPLLGLVELLPLTFPELELGLLPLIPLLELALPPLFSEPLSRT
jgi:hypothetical protein